MQASQPWYMLTSMQKSCYNICISVVFLLFQEDAEDRQVVAVKLADLKKQQKELDAVRKMLDAEDDCLGARNARVAEGL